MTNKEALDQIVEAIEAYIDQKDNTRATALSYQQELLALQRRTAEALERIVELIDQWVNR